MSLNTRFRHTHMVANALRRLRQNISWKAHGWRSLALHGAQVGSSISESLGDKQERTQCKESLG